MVERRLQLYSPLTVAKCIMTLDAYFGTGFSESHKEMLLQFVLWRIRQL